jgi:hypothetical protein
MKQFKKKQTINLLALIHIKCGPVQTGLKCKCKPQQVIFSLFSFFRMHIIKFGVFRTVVRLIENMCE